MSAYVIAEVEVTDPAAYDEYRVGVAATVEAHGGRFLVRGGAVESIEGSWQPKRLVVVEFPSLEQARAWYTSPAYSRLAAIRHRTAESKLVFVEGVG